MKNCIARYERGSISIIAGANSQTNTQETNNMTSSRSRTGQGYRINSKQSARRVGCRADDSPLPRQPQHQSHQQDEAIRCSTMPQFVATPGVESSSKVICHNVEKKRTQSKVAVSTVNSKEQSQRQMYRWRNQQLTRGERPRAAVAPVCGTLPGTLVDANRGPPPANVDDDNRPNSRQYDHLVLPYGIYCTLVALASLSFSIVIIYDIIYAKRSAYTNYSLSLWAPDIGYLAIILLTGCVAILLPVAILVARRDENNATLPILWNQPSCEGCKMCCTTQIGPLKVAIPVLCLVNIFFHGALYLTFQGSNVWWFAGMIVWLALAITGFVFLCCVARNDSR